MLKEAQQEKARLMENRVSSPSTLDIKPPPVSQLSVGLGAGSINDLNLMVSSPIDAMIAQ